MAKKICRIFEAVEYSTNFEHMKNGRIFDDYIRKIFEYKNLPKKFIFDHIRRIFFEYQKSNIFRKIRRIYLIVGRCTCSTKPIQNHLPVHVHNDTHMTILDQKMEIPSFDRYQGTSQQSYLRLLRNNPSRFDYSGHQKYRHHNNLKLILRG